METQHIYFQKAERQRKMEDRYITNKTNPNTVEEAQNLCQ